MPTLYTTTRFPVAFTTVAPQSVMNGTMTSASIVSHIAENQLYLACGDTPSINFYLRARAVSATGAGMAAWTNDSRTVAIPVPPFAQYCEFYFYAWRAEAAGDAIPYIDVRENVGSVKRRISVFARGDDLTGKSGMTDGYFGQWVHASGVTGSANTTDPGALPIVATASANWTSASVTITVSADVFVHAAAYHVLPGNSAYTVLTGGGGGKGMP